MALVNHSKHSAKIKKLPLAIWITLVKSPASTPGFFVSVNCNRGGRKRACLSRPVAHSWLAREHLLTTMKALKFLAVILILVSSAFAQKQGVFVTAGGGFARMKASNFVVYNPLAGTSGGEPLATTDTTRMVNVARLTVGYNFTDEWALQVSYADYGTAEVKVASPQYPGVTFASYYDNYTRLALKYKPTVLTLMPSYTYAVGEKSRVIVGAGISSSKTSSHFETIVQPTWPKDSTATPTTPIPPTVSTSYAEETNQSYGYIVSLGLDHLLTENISVQIIGNYAAFKANVPASPWESRSKASISITALSAELALAWHW